MVARPVPQQHRVPPGGRSTQLLQNGLTASASGRVIHPHAGAGAGRASAVRTGLYPVCRDATHPRARVRRADDPLSGPLTCRTGLVLEPDLDLPRPHQCRLRGVACDLQVGRGLPDRGHPATPSRRPCPGRPRTRPRCGAAGIDRLSGSGHAEGRAPVCGGPTAGPPVPQAEARPPTAPGRLGADLTDP